MKRIGLLIIIALAYAGTFQAQVTLKNKFEGSLAPLYPWGYESSIKNLPAGAVFYNTERSDDSDTYNLFNINLEKIRTVTIPRQKYQFKYTFQPDEIHTGYLSFLYPVPGETTNVNLSFSDTGDAEYMRVIFGDKTYMYLENTEVLTPIVGYEIVGEKGGVKSRLRFPEQFHSDNYISLTSTFTIYNGRKIVLFSVKEYGTEKDYTLIYDFGKESGVRSISEEPRLMRIVPTAPRSSEPITISFDSDSQRTISVISAAGQTIYQKNTSSASLNIPSEILPKGVNIIACSENGISREVQKIIIR